MQSFYAPNFRFWITVAQGRHGHEVGPDQEAENQRFFGQLNGEARDAWLRATALNPLLVPMVELAGAFGTALLYAFGASLILREQLTVGALVAFASYLTTFWEPINRLSTVYTQLLTVMAGAEAIFALFDTRPSVLDRPGARDLPPLAGHVRFDRVSFAYGPGRPALSGIDLEVRPGETVALVGHTGSGKTTLVNLLLRFYAATEGRILVDGVDIRAVTAASLRRQMAVVLHDLNLACRYAHHMVV